MIREIMCIIYEKLISKVSARHKTNRWETL